nr:MAG TPA: hypothetical protein [Caudoviricetes sp.]
MLLQIKWIYTIKVVRGTLVFLSLFNLNALNASSLDSKLFLPCYFTKGYSK